MEYEVLEISDELKSEIRTLAEDDLNKAVTKLIYKNEFYKYLEKKVAQS